MRTAWLCLALLASCTREDAPRVSASPPEASTSPPPAVPTPTPAPSETVAEPTPEPTAPELAPPAANLVTLVDLDAQAGPLEQQLAAVAARATAEGRPLAVELWAGWCPPCKKFDRLLAGGPVADALRGAILVRVDVDMFDDELNALGFTAPQIPSLYRLDGRGKPKGKPLQGGDWGRRDAAAIASALAGLLAR